MAIEARLTVLIVMVGGLYAVALPILWLVLRLAAKAGLLGF